MATTPSLKTLFEALTVNDLKEYQRKLSIPSNVVRKADLIKALIHALSNPSTLQAIYDILDEAQQLAVAETLYWTEGFYDQQRFYAKYGTTPNFKKTEKNIRTFYNREEPTALTLLLHPYNFSNGYCYVLADEIASKLRDFVDKPDAYRLTTVDELPDECNNEVLVVRHRERNALTELALLLNSVEKGKIRVSEKTGLPGKATTDHLSEQLPRGDDYHGREKRDEWDNDIGAIRAFSWPLLLQASKLVGLQSGRLNLSQSGIKSLNNLSADTILSIWTSWLKYTAFDEFSRINIIKGQKSKGKVMTAVPERRKAIVDALKACPINEWIELASFSDFMQTEGFDFEVTHFPWSLYIYDREYGSLGYDGFHDWNIVQRRYLHAFLFEYAATLGLIDIAYVDPDAGIGEYDNLWGVDDLSYLSRYDGLMYFRINAMGAYCLGLVKQYVASEVSPNVRLSVMHKGQITPVAGTPSAEEILLLDTWCIKVEENSWQLDKAKIMAALERGMKITELSDFLRQREEQPLPESVEALMNQCAKNIGALKSIKPALLIECIDRDIATSIAEHREAKKLCLLAGERHLVVRSEHEERLRELIRVIGYGMAIH